MVLNHLCFYIFFKVLICQGQDTDALSRNLQKSKHVENNFEEMSSSMCNISNNAVPMQTNLEEITQFQAETLDSRSAPATEHILRASYKTIIPPNTLNINPLEESGLQQKTSADVDACGLSKLALQSTAGREHADEISMHIPVNSMVPFQNTYAFPYEPVLAVQASVGVENKSLKLNRRLSSQKSFTYHASSRPGTDSLNPRMCSKKFGFRDYSRLLKPHKCEVCSAGFRSPAMLRQHMVVHTGERPFKCTLCSAAFTQHSNMKRHRIRTHADNNYSLCKICGRAFRYAKSLSQHYAIHHYKAYAYKKSSNKNDILVTDSNSSVSTLEKAAGVDVLNIMGPQAGSSHNSSGSSSAGVPNTSEYLTLNDTEMSMMLGDCVGKEHPEAENSKGYQSLEKDSSQVTNALTCNRIPRDQFWNIAHVLHIFLSVSALFPYSSKRQLPLTSIVPFLADLKNVYSHWSYSYI